MQDIYHSPCQALGFGLRFRQPFLCSLQMIIFHVRLSVTYLLICNAISRGRIVVKQKRLVLNGSGFGLRAAVRSGAPVPSWLFLEHGAALSAGSAVFEGTPAPLIRPGTPRCERAPSPGSPHCEFLFLSLRSPHSVKRRGTSSISPVRNVNRRFNQTLRLLPPCHLLYATLLPTKYLFFWSVSCSFFRCFFGFVTHAFSNVFSPQNGSRSCFIFGRSHFASSWVCFSTAKAHIPHRFGHRKVHKNDFLLYTSPKPGFVG